MAKINNDIPIEGVLKWIRAERDTLQRKLDQIVPYAKRLEKEVETLKEQKQGVQKQFSDLQKQFSDLQGRQAKDLNKIPEFKAMREKYVRVKEYNTALNNLVGKLHQALSAKEEILKGRKWICCEDSLPSESGWYFTCIEMSGAPQSVGVTYFYAGLEEWKNFEVVEYWMAIPKIS